MASGGSDGNGAAGGGAGQTILFAMPFICPGRVVVAVEPRAWIVFPGFWIVVRASHWDVVSHIRSEHKLHMFDLVQP